MEKFSTFNTDKKYTEVIAQLDCCETCESATFSENKKTKQQQPTTAVIRVWRDAYLQQMGIKK